MSSLNEISADPLGNIGWWRGGGGRYSPYHYPILQQASGQIIKDDVNGFSSISDTYFMLIHPPPHHPLPTTNQKQNCSIASYTM
jgi:hypothetical protein